MKMKYASLFILLITTLIPGIILGANYSNCYYSEMIKTLDGFFAPIIINAHMDVQDTVCSRPNGFCKAIVYCDEGAKLVTCKAIQVGEKLYCPSASDCINETDKISVDAESIAESIAGSLSEEELEEEE